MSKDTIIFGGGCFWCTEAVFKMLKGVFSIEPGYAGGLIEPDGFSEPERPERSEGQGVPTYEQVCGGTTGYAEVVKIEYNPKVIPLEKLLTVFFATHDSTTKNRQENDIGEQYRSIILYITEEQKNISEKFVEELNESAIEGKPIVTEIKKLDMFYPAEDYHKNYYKNNKGQIYCQMVINPKLKKVKEKFSELLAENRK